MSEFKTIKDVPFKQCEVFAQVHEAMKNQPVPFEGLRNDFRKWQFRNDKVSVVAGAMTYSTPRAFLSDVYAYDGYEVWVTGEDDVRTVSKAELIDILNA